MFTDPEHGRYFLHAWVRRISYTWTKVHWMHTAQRPDKYESLTQTGPFYFVVLLRTFDVSCILVRTLYNKVTKLFSTKAASVFTSKYVCRIWQDCLLKMMFLYTSSKNISLYISARGMTVHKERE